MKILFDQPRPRTYSLLTELGFLIITPLKQQQVQVEFSAPVVIHGVEHHYRFAVNLSADLRHCHAHLYLWRGDQAVLTDHARDTSRAVLAKLNQWLRGNLHRLHRDFYVMERFG